MSTHVPEESMKPIRQGDVLLSPDSAPLDELDLRKLDHCTLAEGEVTGHSHRITQGEAELYQNNEVLYLKVLSKTALLTHEEHAPVSIPHGTWMVRIQREYQPEGLMSTITLIAG
jgi:hypothetical protein